MSETHPALYERRDVNVRAILAVAAALIVIGALVHLAAWWAFDALQARERAGKQPAFPLAAQESGRLPPEPRLEQIDRMAGKSSGPGKLYATEEERLRTYGWVDEKVQIAHIPIDQAMNAIVKQQRPRPQP